MIAGTILQDNQFKFRDKTTGNKLFIVLNDGTCGQYIAVKTTSKQHGRGVVYGCQNADIFANFFLPKSATWFKENTWVCLDEFYSYKTSELLTGKFAGRITALSNLPVSILKELLKCAIDSPDIEFDQQDILIKTLNNLA